MWSSLHWVIFFPSEQTLTFSFAILQKRAELNSMYVTTYLNTQLFLTYFSNMFLLQDVLFVLRALADSLLFYYLLLSLRLDRPALNCQRKNCSLSKLIFMPKSKFFWDKVSTWWQKLTKVWCQRVYPLSKFKIRWAN